MQTVFVTGQKSAFFRTFTSQDARSRVKRTPCHYINDMLCIAHIRNLEKEFLNVKSIKNIIYLLFLCCTCHMFTEIQHTNTQTQKMYGNLPTSHNGLAANIFFQFL